ncbi:MAG: ATP-binding protein [Candidatus Aminicenantes bacterium]|nr:ATP-binding protein [Candidatus Aminicenantes bacterium]
MLIEFKVTNYRSIKDEQILSLVASNYDDSLPENLIHPNLPGLSKVKLLKGVALYGPNASGKSNVLDALRFMANFVRHSATRIAPNELIDTKPFCLDVETLDKPSCFEVMVVIEEVRYVYGFTLDKQRVYQEYLVAFPKGSAQNWFRRIYDPKKNDYIWSHSASFFKLDSDLCSKTRPNSLFVSTAAQFNNEQLTAIYNWFSDRCRFINLGAGSRLGRNFTANLIEEQKQNVTPIIALLKSADFGITDADVKHKELSAEEIKATYSPSVVRDMESTGKLTGLKTLEISFKHRGASGKDSLIDFTEESAGTQRFFSLVGPWLDILEHGYTVLVDELETSLHPMLVSEFLKLLFSSKLNTKGAQVIFATHNPILLDTDIIRRDQVWFTEKDDNGATHLYPLTDYKPRKTESLVRGYLAGRYGAIPFIPEGLKIK